MNIRQAGKADMLAVEQVSKACGFPVPELALDEGRIRAMFVRGEIILIAEESEAVGYAAIDPNPKGKAELYSIEVRKEMHHRGIGTELMKAAEEKAKSLGKGEIFLYCHPRNREAMTFYSRLGYANRGLVPGHYSTGEPAVLFTKRLD